MIAVPDYVEPVVGWRSWTLARTPDGFRLRSVIFGTLWEPRHELEAECLARPRRRLLHPWHREPPHEGPSRNCDCGIYAADTAERAGMYLDDRATPWSALNRVIGLVALWGNVVQCDTGWRASRAYPVRVFLPSYGAGRRKDAFELRRTLLDYAVPVEQLDCGHRVELVALLTGLEPALRRSA
jgi:hypothetical protein